jgi:hypothetical protein
MPGAAAAGDPVQRPDCMVELGLLPPYVMEDVREAYRQKALGTHPDRGGDAAAFSRLSKAYDRALEYVRFQGDRRAWIANQVEWHLLQEEVAAEIRSRNGEVEFEHMDWVKASWGDGFEVLASRLRTVRMRGLRDGDAFLAYLGSRQLPYLTGLDLAGSHITDAGLRSLATFAVMQWLDLSETQVTFSGLRAALDQWPALTRLNVKGTGLGCLRRWLLARSHPRVSVVGVSPGAQMLSHPTAGEVLLPDRR